MFSIPRRKPDKIVEHRISLSTWERERIEALGLTVGMGFAGLGIGALALPLALVGGGIISALLLADDLDAMLDKVKALPQAVLGDPNDLGGEKAEKHITSELSTINEDIGGTPYELYKDVANWRKSQRTAAFVAIHGPGSQDDPKLAATWAQWIEDNPLPFVMQLNKGVGAGGGAAGGGVMYQTSIRATAARRAGTAKGNLLSNPLGAVATWMGEAAGGPGYYTKPEKASGYISDPLLDLAATRIGTLTGIPWKSSGTATWDGAQVGLAIEKAWRAALALA